MLKKGGVFLSIIFCASLAIAQSPSQPMFQENNPNLVNLNEPKEYTGAPLMYIQGVKAPEKANNDIEELQLKLFGTKDVRNATRDNLAFQPIVFQDPNTQKKNLTIETPFHESVQAGFIHHIPDFIVMIQVLNNQEITITEQINVMNTDEGEIWTRDIPLPRHTTANLISYTQNGQEIPVNVMGQQNNLVFTSPIPLQIGLNRIILKYNLTNAIQKDGLTIDITGSQLAWPIERVKALVLFSSPVTIRQNKALFGTNYLDVPQSYTTHTEQNGNTVYQFTRVIPEFANIHLKLEFDPKELLAPGFFEKIWANTSYLIEFSLISVLFLYWLANALWELHKGKKKKLPKITQKTNWIEVALQLGIRPTIHMMNQLAHFKKLQGQPVQKLYKQLAKAEHHQKNPRISWKLKIKTLWGYIGEIIIGTALLISIAWIISYLQHTLLSSLFMCYTIGTSIMAIILLYYFVLKPTVTQRWLRLVQNLESQQTIIGLTQEHARLYYPMMVLVEKNQEWITKLTTLNPKAASAISTKGKI